jgi:uncharacterized protein
MNNIEILSELKGLLENAFPGSIHGVILFGSQAAGWAREGSDFDILVIINGNADWKTKQRISDIAYEMDLKYGILTDVTVMSQKEMKTIKGRQPFIQEALEYGIAA